MLVKILARHLKCEVNTGTDAVPVMTPIGGMNSYTFETEKEDVDDTDFDSDGYAEHKVVQRAASISGEGFYKEDPATGDRDPGQEALIAAADKIGYDSLIPFHVTTPGGHKTVYQVSVKANAPGGGGTNDNAAFSFELTVSGKPAYTPPAP